MEGAKRSCAGEKPIIDENSSLESQPEAVDANPPSRRPSRSPFTSLSQIDADLALARTLQEQERAYMMLKMGGGTGSGSEFDGFESGSYVYDEEAVDVDGDEEANSDDDGHPLEVHGHTASLVIDPSSFESDEAYARALQAAEEREVAVHLMALAGINDWEAEDQERLNTDDQDTLEEVDPDQLSYEELLALGEVVGTESRGLSADMVASLPSTTYRVQSTNEGSTDQCTICQLDYEDGDGLTVLLCKHAYHPNCINRWLQINKLCPVCNAEVSTSENKQNSLENRLV